MLQKPEALKFTNIKHKLKTTSLIHTQANTRRGMMDVG